jgi:uncharacterized protein
VTPAGGPGAGGRRSWRKLNNALHRDVGYLIVGLTIVYGVSGLAVNHRADWNPSYRSQKRALRIEPVRATERAEIVRQAQAALGLGEPRNVFRPDPQTLQLFYEAETYSVDLPTGAVIVDANRPRPVLYEMNQLHLNTPKGAWTWIADLYAVALLFVAGTGLFVLKGRTGITGRGAWLTALGIVVPIVCWLLLAAGTAAPGGRLHRM